MKDKQYYIYIRSTNEQIPVTKEEFAAYYKEIDLYRQKQMYHKRCVCPKSKWLTCDMDCYTCPFRRNGDDLSLNYRIYDNEDESMELVEELADSSPCIDDFLADTYEMTELMKRLTELMPEAIKIGERRLDGISDEAIAREIGIGRKTFQNRTGNPDEGLQLKTKQWSTSRKALFLVYDGRTDHGGGYFLCSF